VQWGEDVHWHMGETQARLTNSTPLIFNGSNNLAGEAFWGYLSTGKRLPIGAGWRGIKVE
jgi:hypothetical protein